MTKFGIRLPILTLLIIINSLLAVNVTNNKTTILNNTTTTTTTTTTSTSTTSTSTTTTTLPTTTTTSKIVLFIKEFKLLKAVYVDDNIKIDYIIKTDAESVPVNLSVTCKSVDYAQAWSVNVKTFLNGTVKMLPMNQTAAPGSLIKCHADIFSSSNEYILQNIETASIQLLTNPPGVSDLIAKPLNETSISLTWSNPHFSIGKYDSLETNCFSNEKNNSKHEMLKQNVADFKQNEFVIHGLVPGGVYKCSVTTLRSVNGSKSKSTSSLFVSTMTKLSEPQLINGIKLENDGSIKLMIKKPEGYYDFFQVQLATEDRIIRQNLTGESSETVIFNEIDAGKIYELFAVTHRLNTSRHSKLFNASILIPPNEVENLNVFVRSTSEISVVWNKPDIGTFDLFTVYVYEQLAGSLTSTSETVNTEVIISNLDTKTPYVISVVSCAKLASRCDKFSRSVNKTFDYETKSVETLEIKNVVDDENLAVMRSKTVTVSAQWVLDPYGFNICDLSRFHIVYSNLNTSKVKNCYSNFIDVSNLINKGECSTNFQNLQPIIKIDPKYKLCTSSEVTCKQSTSIITCSMKLTKMSPNTMYIMKLAPVSLNGDYEWPSSVSPPLQTRFSLPNNFESIQVLADKEIQLSMYTGSMLSIIRPAVDETNGKIYEAFLFIVNIGSLSEEHIKNTSLVFVEPKFTINTTDQEYLTKLTTDPSCLNITINSPCLLKQYSQETNDFSSKELVFIGNLTAEGSSSALNLTGIQHENISTSVVKPFNVYQLFYVFRIGNNKTSSVLFSTEPSEPIKTFNLFTGSNGQRNGLDVWAVVMISIISLTLLVVVIVCLIIMLVIRYRPGKFHKAVVSHPRRNSNLKMKSSEKLNEYGHSIGACGVFYDFIEPGEFTRYDMTNIWLVKHANGDLIFDEEYRNLPDYRNMKSSYASQAIKNEIKNRFLDIKAYDDSRVVLESNSPHYTLSSKKHDTNSQVSVDKSIISSMSTSTSSSNNSGDLHMLENNGNGDYINANFVQGYSHDRKFIATQGPKRETIVDFWRMINQYQVTAIVMLTKLVEKGVERCTQYWPDKLNIPEQYGEIEVTMKEQVKCGDYIKRTFELVRLTKDHFQTGVILTPVTSGTLRNRSRPLTVTQYYYPEWPDKDTPSTDPMSILHLIRDVNLNHLQYQYPIVVHCSAGVGRTGTYITLDAMMEKINNEGKINIFGFISKIRERRQYLVQTSKQYVFIHEALYEYCMYGFTDVDEQRLLAHYKYLKDISPYNANGIPYPKTQSTKTRLQIEYEKLNNAFVANCQAREAFSYENKTRNRYLDNICYDENRVKLSGLNGSSFINATKVKGYEVLQNELIITQDPMKHTVFEFWKMITEYDCNVIVSLNKDFENELESVYWPSASELIKEFECEDLKFTVELISPINSVLDGQSVTVRELQVTEQKYDGSRTIRVTQFVYNEQWPEGRAPQSKDSLIELIKQVHCQMNTLVRSRIAVHAHGGASNCSIFCALSILIDNLKNEQHVDVCRTVKKLKTQRPHMIETFEQYDFMYQCLVDFVQQRTTASTCLYLNSPGDLNDIELRIGSNI